MNRHQQSDLCPSSEHSFGPQENVAAKVIRQSSGGVSSAPQDVETSRAALESREPLNGSKNHKENDATLSNGHVIPPEQVAALRASLAEFEAVLLDLVRESESDHETGFLRLLGSGIIDRLTGLRAFSSRVFSRSLFGRQLTQDELIGEYANLLPMLEQTTNLMYADTALFGLLALRARRLPVAQSILEEVKFATSPAVALTYVMRGASRTVFFLFGLLYFVPAILVLLKDQNAMNFEECNWWKVLIAGVCGVFGGFANLLMRLGEFEATRGRSRQFLVLTGTTLPICGGIFASVVASLLATNIITVGSTAFSIWHFVVVGFLAGFSERFTRNLLRIAETQFSRSPGASTPSEAAHNRTLVERSPPLPAAKPATS
jgi:hypothetical protein